jgi:hypothetical protein
MFNLQLNSLSKRNKAAPLMCCTKEIKHKVRFFYVLVRINLLLAAADVVDADDAWGGIDRCAGGPSV